MEVALSLCPALQNMPPMTDLIKCGIFHLLLKSKDPNNSWTIVGTDEKDAFYSGTFSSQQLRFPSLLHCPSTECFCWRKN